MPKRRDSFGRSESDDSDTEDHVKVRGSLKIKVLTLSGSRVWSRPRSISRSRSRSESDYSDTEDHVKVKGASWSRLRSRSRSMSRSRSELDTSDKMSVKMYVKL